MSNDSKNQDKSNSDESTSDSESSSENEYSDSFNVEVNEKRIEDKIENSIGDSLDKLASGFTESARRWEMIVYPSLVAFIILAAYGFFLIYSLTSDVTRVANDMHKITVSMEQVAVNMNAVTKNMVVMTQTTDSQAGSMREMVYHIRGMNMSINQMRYDISNVSRPMSFMNDFLPW